MDMFYKKMAVDFLNYFIRRLFGQPCILPENYDQVLGEGSYGKIMGSRKEKNFVYKIIKNPNECSKVENEANVQTMLYEGIRRFYGNRPKLINVPKVHMFCKHPSGYVISDTCILKMDRLHSFKDPLGRDVPTHLGFGFSSSIHNDKTHYILNISEIASMDTYIEREVDPNKRNVLKRKKEAIERFNLGWFKSRENEKDGFFKETVPQHPGVNSITDIVIGMGRMLACMHHYVFYDGVDMEFLLTKHMLQRNGMNIFVKKVSCIDFGLCKPIYFKYSSPKKIESMMDIFFWGIAPGYKPPHNFFLVLCYYIPSAVTNMNACIIFMKEYLIRSFMIINNVSDERRKKFDKGFNKSHSFNFIKMVYLWFKRYIFTSSLYLYIINDYVCYKSYLDLMQPELKHYIHLIVMGIEKKVFRAFKNRYYSVTEGVKQRLNQEMNNPYLKYLLDFDNSGDIQNFIRDTRPVLGVEQIIKGMIAPLMNQNNTVIESINMVKSTFDRLRKKRPDVFGGCLTRESYSDLKKKVQTLQEKRRQKLLRREERENIKLARERQAMEALRMQQTHHARERQRQMEIDRARGYKQTAWEEEEEEEEEEYKGPVKYEFTFDKPGGYAFKEDMEMEMGMFPEPEKTRHQFKTPAESRTIPKERQRFEMKDVGILEGTQLEHIVSRLQGFNPKHKKLIMSFIPWIQSSKKNT